MKNGLESGKNDIFPKWILSISSYSSSPECVSMACENISGTLLDLTKSKIITKSNKFIIYKPLLYRRAE